jgi:spermidine/putrescine transport system substrate-binding protein
VSAGRTLRVLAWPGMPAAEAIDIASERLEWPVSVSVVASNEALEAELSHTGEDTFDLIFPSDYLVERLATAGRLLPLDRNALPLERLADWSVAAAHDPGCRWSVPFAFGTTGYLTRFRRANSWQDLFDPKPGRLVGMLEEVREVVGAALIASGHGPNEITEQALGAARALLVGQRPSVARYDSDDFVAPVVSGEVDIHHAWSGPAVRAVHRHSQLRYVVPDEGAIIWITAAAIPAGAPDSVASTALLRELMNPDLAALTTLHSGFATPNEAARRRLPIDLRDDENLFPSTETLARCHALHDLGENETLLASAWPFESDTARAGARRVPSKPGSTFSRPGGFDGFDDPAARDRY